MSYSYLTLGAGTKAEKNTSPPAKAKEGYPLAVSPFHTCCTFSCAATEQLHLTCHLHPYLVPGAAAEYLYPTCYNLSIQVAGPSITEFTGQLCRSSCPYPLLLQQFQLIRSQNPADGPGALAVSPLRVLLPRRGRQLHLPAVRPRHGGVEGAQRRRRQTRDRHGPTAGRPSNLQLLLTPEIDNKTHNFNILPYYEAA